MNTRFGKRGRHVFPLLHHLSKKGFVMAGLAFVYCVVFERFGRVPYHFWFIVVPKMVV